MNPIKVNTDRVVINRGGSSFSQKPSVAMSNTTNLMAVQPFARTAYGHALMGGQIAHSKLNFDYNPSSSLGPSDSAMS